MALLMLKKSNMEPLLRTMVCSSRMLCVFMICLFKETLLLKRGLRPPSKGADVLLLLRLSAVASAAVL
jgi:hypothetical protein